MLENNESQATNKAKMTLVREAYISRNLARGPKDPPITLRVIAEEHNLQYNYVRSVAAKEKWNDLLQQRVEQVATGIAERVTYHAIFDELLIRVRHSQISQKLSEIAVKRLDGLTDEDIKKLSMRDVVDLLKLGLSEERKAVGLPDEMTISLPSEQAIETDRVSMATFGTRARKLLELVKEADGSFAMPEET